MWHRWIGRKMPLCKWHTFKMVPCLSYCFIVLLFNTVKKWLFMRNLVTIVPLKFKLSGKFQQFNAIDGSMKILKYSWISKYFNSNEKFWNILRDPNSDPPWRSYSPSLFLCHTKFWFLRNILGNLGSAILKFLVRNHKNDFYSPEES